MQKDNLIKVLRYVLIMAIILEVILDYTWLSWLILILIIIYVILKIHIIVKRK